MKDKPGSDLASKMKAARELLEAGEVREALALAMDVLWRELDQLQAALKTVEEHLPRNQAAATGGGAWLGRIRLARFSVAALALKPVFQ